MNQFKELDILIDFIFSKFYSINSDWENNSSFTKLNMKNKKVHNLLEDYNLFDIAYNYRNFLNKYSSDIYTNLENLKLNNEVEMRIKDNNSLQDKIKRYCNDSKHEYGHIPINKCVNDLLGFRIVFAENIDFYTVINYINNKYSNLICKDSSKGAYSAVHIYFVSDDNFKFRWELQIWNKIDYIKNKQSHEKYKQEYTKYEYKLMEGEQND